MIKPEQIPDEVVEAAARSNYEGWRKREDLLAVTLPWEDIEDEARVAGCLAARETIAAAINAWPDKEEDFVPIIGGPVPAFAPYIRLPLPQEKNDD